MELKNFFAQDLLGNVIPSPMVYLYEAGTSTLANGLQDADGEPLTNPFQASAVGQIQIAAPDGDYDLRVVGAGRDSRMRVRYIDVVAGSVNVLRDELSSDAEGKGAGMIHYSGTTLDKALGRKRKAASLHNICARMAAGEVVKLAAIGDSTTDGNHSTGHTINPVDAEGNAIGNTDHEATAPNAWPAKLKALLRAMFQNTNIEVWNAGYSGKRMDNGWALQNYDKAVTDNPFYGTPDLGFVAFSLNDAAIEGSQIDDHVTQSRLLCTKMLDAGTLPVLVASDAMWLVAPNVRDHKEVSRQLDEAKRALAAELDIPFFDVSMIQREWMERNLDGYRWAIEQFDGLHGQDDWQAFKATATAVFLFRDTFVYDGSAPQQLQLMDSRAGRIPTASANTQSTNMRQGVSMFHDVSGGQVLATAWIWNTDPNAEFIYRGINGEGWDSEDFGAAPLIRITEFIKGNVVAEKTPAGAGLQATIYSLSELPYRISGLPYGLVKVEYIAGSDPVSTHWIGAFELWSTVPGSRAYSDCLQVGVYQSVGGPASEVELLPERHDGSNVFGLTGGEYVDVFVEAALATRAGVVIAHANSWGGEPDRPYGSKGFLYLLRGAFDATTLGVGHVQPDGAISYIPLLDVANINLAGRQKFRVRMYRNGANRCVSVYPGWDFSATPETLTLDSTGVVLPLAGAIGGVYFEPAAPGVYRQSSIYQIFKRQGMLSADVSAGVEPVTDYPPMTEIAGSAVAASCVGAADGTAEKTLATIKIPRLSPHAALRVSALFSAPVGSGGNKTYRYRLNGALLSTALNSASAAYASDVMVRNRGATNSQITNHAVFGGATASVHSLTAADTSKESTLTITCQLDNVADAATLDAYSVVLVKP